MAQQTRSVQGSVEQLRTRIRRLQREVATQRKALEKELTTRRRAIEKRAQKEFARARKELVSQPLVKRADSLRAGAQSRLEAGVAGLLDALPLASKAEIARIDRKLRSIDRKLREMERSAGAA